MSQQSDTTREYIFINGIITAADDKFLSRTCKKGTIGHIPPRVHKTTDLSEVMDLSLSSIPERMWKAYITDKITQLILN